MDVSGRNLCVACNRRQCGLVPGPLDQHGGHLLARGAGLRRLGGLWQPGQSILNGPGQVNSDFSVGKRSRVGGLRDGAELAFRVAFYNAMNHSQFANPGSTFRTASFDVITQTAVAPRLIQFGVQYLF